MTESVEADEKIQVRDFNSGWGHGIWNRCVLVFRVIELLAFTWFISQAFKTSLTTKSSNALVFIPEHPGHGIGVKFSFCCKHSKTKKLINRMKIQVEENKDLKLFDVREESVTDACSYGKLISLDVVLSEPSAIRSVADVLFDDSNIQIFNKHSFSDLSVHVAAKHISKEGLRILFANVVTWHGVLQKILPEIARQEKLDRNGRREQETAQFIMNPYNEWTSLIPDFKNDAYVSDLRYHWNFLPILGFLGIYPMESKRATIEYRGSPFISHRIELQPLIELAKSVVLNLHDEIHSKPLGLNDEALLEHFFVKALKRKDLYEFFKIGYGEKWPECWRAYRFLEEIKHCQKRLDEGTERFGKPLKPILYSNPVKSEKGKGAIEEDEFYMDLADIHKRQMDENEDTFGDMNSPYQIIQEI